MLHRISKSAIPVSPSPSSCVVSSKVETHNDVLLLENAELWKQFNSIGNEMIITKTGRCLFPSLKFKVTGLDPYGLYKIELDFEQLSPERFKFRNDQWVMVSSTDLSKNQSQFFRDKNNKSHTTRRTTREYVHPDSPQSGAYWTENGVSFTKIKLTNRLEISVENRTSNDKISLDPESALPEGYFPLKTFHRYQPRVHLIKLKQESHLVQTFTFQEAAFIAVTHYQNNAVNQLKKEYNPHAKGFRTIENDDIRVFPAHTKSLKRTAVEEKTEISKRYLTSAPSQTNDSNDLLPRLLPDAKTRTEDDHLVKLDTHALPMLNLSKSVIQLPPPTPAVSPAVSQSIPTSSYRYEKSTLRNRLDHHHHPSNTSATSTSMQRLPRYSTPLPPIMQHPQLENDEIPVISAQRSPLGTSYEDPNLLTSKVSSAASSLLLLGDRPLHFGEPRRPQE